MIGCLLPGPSWNADYFHVTNSTNDAHYTSLTLECIFCRIFIAGWQDVHRILPTNLKICLEKIGKAFLRSILHLTVQVKSPDWEWEKHDNWDRAAVINYLAHFVQPLSGHNEISRFSTHKANPRRIKAFILCLLLIFVWVWNQHAMKLYTAKKQTLPTIYLPFFFLICFVCILWQCRLWLGFMDCLVKVKMSDWEGKEAALLYTRLRVASRYALPLLTLNSHCVWREMEWNWTDLFVS